MSTREIPRAAQVVTATVRAFGTQISRVRAEYAGGLNDAPYVSVQVGSTVTYAYDLAAVRSFRQAREQAMARPMTLLIERPKHLPPHREFPTAVSVTVRTRQPYRVLAVGADATGDRLAHVIVTVGPLSLITFDRLAAASFADALYKAERLAQSVLEDPEPDAFDECNERMDKAAMRAFEMGGPVPAKRS